MMQFQNSFEKSCFHIPLEEISYSIMTLLSYQLGSFEKSCLSHNLFVTHSSVGNRVKVRTSEQAVVFVCNFERPRSDRALANQMRDRYATFDWTRRDRLKSA